MEPWGSPVLTFFHVKKYKLKTTRCFPSFKNLRKRFSKFTYMRFWVSLKMIPLYHTISNAFETSRKRFLTSMSSSRKLYISWVKDNSWLMQESPHLKSDWLEEMSLFSIKNSDISLNINLSRIFPQIGSSDTRR